MKRKTVERFPNGAVWSQQEQLLAVDKDWQREWVGLPEYVQLTQEPYALIHVRFATAEDLAEFGRLIGQRVQRTTKAIWYPEIVKGIHSHHEWVNEQSSDSSDDAVELLLGDENRPVDPQGAQAQAADEGFHKKPKKLLSQLSMFSDE